MPEAEFQRLKLPMDDWKFSCINSQFEVCKSYPCKLFFPSSVSKETILGCAKYRSAGRLPALNYYHAPTKSCMVRCAQPLAGVSGKNSKDDQMLLDAIRKTCGDKSTLMIFDARSKIAAGANRLKGKGTEDMAHYPDCRVLFLDIENIHAMRESIDGLMKLSSTSHRIGESDWTVLLQNTKWLWHIQGILSSALTIAKYLAIQGNPVMVHCSDGWDRTSQLCALAQILVEPYYRTAKGLQIVIEREFISFGHKFKDRLGNVPDKPDERSPVFVQFIDAVWQILQQFPNEFEFTESYLLAIFEYHQSGWFGNFQDNSDQQRTQFQRNSNSLTSWAYLDAFMMDSVAKNPGYNPSETYPQTVLFPITSVKVLRLWTDAYLRYDHIFFDRFDIETVCEDVNDGSELDKAERMLGDASIDIPEDTVNIDDVDQREFDTVIMTPNYEAVTCRGCNKSFGFFRRKNHCRQCGYVYCDACIQYADLPQYNDLKKKKRKICDRCLQGQKINL